MERGMILEDDVVLTGDPPSGGLGMREHGQDGRLLLGAGRALIRRGLRVGRLG